MKLTKFGKKMVAVVCAIALVVSGVVFSPIKEAKADYNMQQLAYDTWTDLGGTIHAATFEWNGATVDAGYDADLKKAKTKQVAGGNWWTYGSQVVATFPDITDQVKAGKKYHISWHIYTEGGVSGNQILTTDGGEANPVDFSSGDVTVEGTVVINSDFQEAGYFIGIAFIPEGVSVIYDEPVITEEEPTTQGPTQEPTTDPSGYGMHKLTNGDWENLGGPIHAFTAVDNAANVEVGYNSNVKKAKTKQVSGGQWWTWATQVVAAFPDLTADVRSGKTYNISWHIYTEGGVSGNVIWTSDSNEQDVDFSSGDLNLTGTLKINPDLNQAGWSIGVMWVPAGVSVLYDDPVVTDQNGNIVYPKDAPTTTAAPTETQTEAPTTTEAPTETQTQAPTETQTQAPTETQTEKPTEAPTETQKPTETAKPGPGPATTAKPAPAPTTAKPKPAKPAKAKVKKATKKKSAKKIKVTLKKIKGAKKYQVKVSKKKNGKALVKKIVKKVKFTLKSKKFKNKKKLYIKARAWNKAGYGAWSKAKKVKIKK